MSLANVSDFAAPNVSLSSLPGLCIANPAIIAAAAALVLGALLIWPKDKSGKEDAIVSLGGLPFWNAWTFFARREDFLLGTFRKTGASMFRFRVLNHQVVALSGEEARKYFFNDKDLDSVEGYKILMGGAPALDEIDIKQEGQDDVAWFNKRLAILLRKERIADVLPTMFEDVDREMATWGEEGRLDPFDKVYNLVFQMTVRMATCRELADDARAVRRLGALYAALERSATPAALLLPWLPTPAKRSKERATRGLYEALDAYVEARRRAEVPSADAFDRLIAEGEQNAEIVGFALNVIFAGVINTRVNSCWILVYLSAHPAWKARVTSEVRALLAAHSDPSSADTLSQRFAAVPVAAWEDGTPALDLAVRETIRLTLSFAALRRNVHGPIRVGGKTVEQGAFMAYAVGDVHMDPALYAEPERFDPARFEPGREEDKKTTHGFLGWGAGRHPCSGMKVAKLEMKLIVALFLVGYEFELVDASGKVPAKLPVPDRNDISEAKPLGDNIYFKYKRVVP